MGKPGTIQDLFIRNRKKIALKLDSNTLAIICANNLQLRNGDQFYPFRQNSDFYYLTGIEQEACVLLIFPAHPKKEYREVLFVTRQTPKEVIYEGGKLGPKDAIISLGIEKVLYIDQFDQVFKDLLYFAKSVYIPQNEYPSVKVPEQDPNIAFAKKLKEEYPALELKRLEPILSSFRLKKDPEELEMMQHACDITEKAFHRVLGFVKPGVMEYQIEAEITHEFLKNRIKSHAYTPIIASGENACTLHYRKNEMECESGKLLLMDFGAEYKNYAADCTRTIPVNGRFSPRQRGVYEAVLRIFKASVSFMVPGTTIAEIDMKVAKLVESELIELGLFIKDDLQNQNPEFPAYKEYLPHGIAHFVGLDVHDVGNKYVVLEEGMVLSCEPALYIREEGLGIRIENNIVVATVPIDLMESIPIEVDEIESLMSRKVLHID